MDWSARLTRRRVVVGGSAFAALSIGKAAAQTAPVAGCDIGFVNGLLQIAGSECSLLTPPGLGGVSVDPPSHVTTFVADDGTIGDEAATDATTTQTQQEVRTERLQAQRDHKREKRSRRTNRKQDNNQAQADHKQRRRENRREHRQNEKAADEAAEAAKKQCDDFTTKDELDAWWEEFKDIDTQLDPDGDGEPCEQIIWDDEGNAEGTEEGDG